MNQVSRAVPQGREAVLDEILDALAEVGEVVITTHANADGDGAGSEAGLAWFLRRMGVAAWIVNPTPYPERYAFLLGDPEWVVAASGAEARDLCRRAGLAVVVDTNDVRRIGRVARLIRGLPKVVIDHHRPSARAIEGLVLADPAACATGQLVFELIERAGVPLCREIASALYTAILTDTGGFRFENTDPACLRTAAVLVEAGAEPGSLHRASYSGHRLRRFRLLRSALATLEVASEGRSSGRVASMIVPKAEYDRLGATPDDLEGFVDVPRDVEGVEVAILHRTTTDGRIKVSLRSVAPVDVHRIAAELGGGGHLRAAAAVVAGPLESAVRDVARRVERALPDAPATPHDSGA